MVVPDNLPEISREWEIDIGKDLSLDMQPISIHNYPMTLTKQKELKDKLKDLLDNDFIQPNIMP